MNIWYGSRENDKLSNLSFRPFLDKDEDSLESPPVLALLTAL